MFRTAGKRGKANKRITVFSNDPENPKLYLSLTGEIVLDVEVTPPSINFGDISIGQTAVQKAEIKVTATGKKVKSVESDDQRFSAKLIPGDAPDKSSLEVTFLGSKTQERIAGGIKIHLDGEDTSATHLPVRVQVVGNLRYPKQFFIMKSDDTFNTRDISIVSRSEKPFKIIDAEDPDGRIKLTFPKTENKEVTVTALVKDPKLTLDTSLKGIVKIRTTDTVDPNIEISYTISKRRSSAEIREQMVRTKKQGTALPLLKKAQAAEGTKSAPVQ